MVYSIVDTERFNSMDEQQKQQQPIHRLNIRRFRARLGFTQKQLAEAAGIAEPTIIDIEKKRVSPRIATAIKVVDALNVRLVEQGKAPITLDSLEWKILGED